MLIHLNIENLIYSIEASPDITVTDLRVLLEAESEISTELHEIKCNGLALSQNNKTLRDYGITGESCQLYVTKRNTALPADSKGDGVTLQPVKTPASTTTTNSFDDFRSLGFDIEEQKRIEEAIQQANIAANLHAALEHHPEAFGSVIMLYVPLSVNSHPLMAFVDCGAQATIMSQRCAERCNLSRLIDKRFGGLARGIGERKIVGRVHAAEMIIGGLHLACSFNIIEDGNDGIDLLFGLDMLRRHQACIDLAKNALVIHGVCIPFLSESEIPKSHLTQAQ